MQRKRGSERQCSGDERWVDVACAAKLGYLFSPELKPQQPLNPDARTHGTLAPRHSVYPETRFNEAERQTGRHIAVCGSIATVVSFYQQPQKGLKHSGQVGRVHREKTRCVRLRLFATGARPNAASREVAFTVSGWRGEVAEQAVQKKLFLAKRCMSGRLAKHETGIRAPYSGGVYVVVGGCLMAGHR
jgi:hypothetical protein